MSPSFAPSHKCKILSTQPINSFDWSPDKDGLAVMSCLDQTVRVIIVTKLHKY